MNEMGLNTCERKIAILMRAARDERLEAADRVDCALSAAAFAIDQLAAERERRRPGSRRAKPAEIGSAESDASNAPLIEQDEDADGIERA